MLLRGELSLSSLRPDIVTLVQSYLVMILWVALAVVYTVLFDYLLNLIGALS